MNKKNSVTKRLLFCLLICMANNFSNISDETLYEYLKSKDKRENLDAFNEIYKRYSTKVYTYCRKVLNNDPAADDIFQETFTRLCEGAKNDRVMTNLSGYIFKIARNLCLTEKPRLLNIMVQLEDIQLPFYDKNYGQQELENIVELTIQSLPEIYREVIIMKEYMNLSYTEIAENLQLTVTVVRVRIFRAKQKLRELLLPYLEDFDREIKNKG